MKVIGGLTVSLTNSSLDWFSDVIARAACKAPVSHPAAHPFPSTAREHVRSVSAHTDIIDQLVATDVDSGSLTSAWRTHGGQHTAK
jgi:hypothetical protein